MSFDPHARGEKEYKGMRPIYELHISNSKPHNEKRNTSVAMRLRGQNAENVYVHYF